MIKVFIAGATGWAGSAIAKGVYNEKGMQLAGGLSRFNKQENLAEIMDFGNDEIPLFFEIEWN